MAKTGRPPIPLEVKQKRGTLRPDKIASGALVEVEKPQAALVPPATLGPVARGYWDKVAHAAGWLWGDVDSALLEITAEAYEERAALRQQVMSNPDDWRSRRGLRELDKQFLVNLAALGFTPADRARLGLIEAKTQSKWDYFVAKYEEINGEAYN